MTVLEASEKLVTYFIDKNYFRLEKDFKKICLVSDDDGDKIAVLAALDELTKENFVIKKSLNGEDIWVLYKPLALQTQNVSISIMTASEIANVINEHVKKDEEKVNPFRITESDLVNLLFLAKNFEHFRKTTV